MSLTVAVPIDLPSPERVEEIYREELRKVAEEHGVWLCTEAAAAYCQMHKRTFERKKKAFRVPASKIDGAIAYYRPDLDALRLANVEVPPGPTVIQFPSIKARAEAVAGDSIKFPSQAAGAA
jgi:hypothetical protein